MASPDPGQGSAHAKAIDVAEGFRDQDMAALARLSRAGRAEQVHIRERLYGYMNAVWDQIKIWDQLTDDDPACSAVAGMRDLVGELHTSALAAAQQAGEEPGRL